MSERRCPHYDGSDIDSYPENPLLHICGRHKELADNVTNDRDCIQHDGHLDEGICRTLVKLGQNHIDYEAQQQRDSRTEPALFRSQATRSNCTPRRLALLPLKESHELHRHEIDQVKQSVSESRAAVFPIDNAHDTVDKHVEKAEKVSVDLSHGRSHGAHDSHKRGERRKKQKRLAILRSS